MYRLPYELKAEIVTHLLHDGERLDGDELDGAWDALESLSLVDLVFSELAFPILWDGIVFSQESTSEVKKYVEEILGRHGRHLRSVGFGDDLLDNGRDSEERLELLRRIFAALFNLEDLTINGPTLLLHLNSPPSFLLQSHPSGHSLRRLDLVGETRSRLREEQVAAFIQLFPNLEELDCTWVGSSHMGEFLRAVQSCARLESLTLCCTALADVEFSMSTEWMQHLRTINIDWDDTPTSPDEIVHFLSNFTATLTDLTLELPTPFLATMAPFLLPRLCNCAIHLTHLADLTHHLRLAEAPIQALRVSEQGVLNEDWSPILPLVRRLKATLRKLVLELDHTEVGIFGTALWAELEDVCRSQAVELKVVVKKDS